MGYLRSFLLLVASALAISVDAFRWKLSDSISARKVLTFSERYMFATKNGPSIMPQQGKSYIDADLNVVAYTSRNSSAPISVAIFAAAEGHHNDNLEGMCGDTDVYMNDWASNIKTDRVSLNYLKDVHIVDPSLGLNGTYHKWGGNIQMKYTVDVEAWHNVAVQMCSLLGDNPVAKVDGYITFKNPYGYIPGELYGYLPFEFFRLIAFLIFGFIYLLAYYKHRSTVLALHHAIVAVFVVALVEAVTWFAAYVSINSTGEPYCCPFPTSVVASLVLQVFRQTFARMLLLVVCLGYGIVRPKLQYSEWVAIVIVSISYFVSAVVAQIAQIVILNDVHNDKSHEVIWYQIPAFFLDILMISWIYFALGSTLRILNEFQQTAKLSMYRKLAAVISFFVFLFALVTVLIILANKKLISWPWQYSWVHQVLWESLNSAVLAAVCIIFLPSQNSRLLSYASQLPTEDPDEETPEHEGPDTPHDFLDDDFEPEDEGDFELTTTNSLQKGGFASLPPAADDEEFGLKD